MILSPPTSPHPPAPPPRKSGSSLKQYYEHDTHDTMTALHLLCRSGSHFRDIKTAIELQPRLISHPTPRGGDTPLHFAVAAHDLDATRLILDTHPAAANIKSRASGNFGNHVTPLHHVAVQVEASFEIIEALVRACPRSTRLRDGDGNTAYQLALKSCERDHIEKVLDCLHT
jgi:ankyrin repeat protein